MIRQAFVMSVHAGHEQEYERRHRPIWPELEKVLKENLQLNAGFLFGKMDSENRTIVINQFREAKLKILVVTDLCARGIDIPSVDFIIHYEFPQNIKSFIHRSGRTARAGRYGTSFLFVSPYELPIVFEIESAVEREISINTFSEYSAKSNSAIDFPSFVDYLSKKKKDKIGNQLEYRSVSFFFSTTFI